MSDESYRLRGKKVAGIILSALDSLSESKN
ncbi:hypothetical protein N7E60_04115 [Salinivibrio proteolyticus]|uniref:IclR family transcriptional regulator n=1 Tax=Salinivibrio proteolyticus TaxID=334715 RepID=A0ABY7LIN6_9GAMM|nr:hypothetical protein [Salinivibrio proteolyticus]WBA16066.1 hypothetical protein N7E60_04115 [Salinivibrio proteolyticus]